MNDKLVHEKALEHARALGCTCEPDISYTKVAGEMKGGIMNLTIAHDDDCALIKGKE